MVPLKSRTREFESISVANAAEYSTIGKHLSDSKPLFVTRDKGYRGNFTEIKIHCRVFATEPIKTYK